MNMINEDDNSESISYKQQTPVQNSKKNDVSDTSKQIKGERNGS
jgi:hypothetical protein